MEDRRRTLRREEGNRKGGQEKAEEKRTKGGGEESREVVMSLAAPLRLRVREKVTGMWMEGYERRMRDDGVAAGGQEGNLRFMVRCAPAIAK